MTLDAAAAAPINMVVSGPTGGVIASRHVAELLGIDHLVTLDMGGTSTDVSTVLGGKESFTTDFEIEWGLPIQIPMIDIRTIGAGGGSIAWIDKGGHAARRPAERRRRARPGLLRPRRHEATVTDANVVLGRIDPDNFLGGRMKLDVAAAREAVGAGRRGDRPDAGGDGAGDRAHRQQQHGRRAALGADRARPRPARLHALRLRRRRPAACQRADRRDGHPARHRAEPSGPVLGLRLHPDRCARRPAAHDAADQPSASTRRARRRGDGRAGRRGAWPSWRRRATTSGIEVHRALEMRYLGQNYELELPIGADALDDRPGGAALAGRSTRRTRPASASASPGEIIEIVNFTVTAIAARAKPELPLLPRGDGGPPKPSGTRRLSARGTLRDAGLSTATLLRAGQVIDGPARDRGGGLGHRASIPASASRSTARPPLHRPPRLRRDHAMRFSANGFYVEKYIKCAQLRAARLSAPASSGRASTAEPAHLLLATGASNGRRLRDADERLCPAADRRSRGCRSRTAREARAARADRRPTW